MTPVVIERERMQLNRSLPGGYRGEVVRSAANKCLQLD